MKKRNLLSLFFLLCSLVTKAQLTDLKPALLPWHEKFRIENMVFSADGQFLVTAGDDKAIVISDLKKRTQLAKITGIVPAVLIAHPSAPFFYTVADRSDSLVLQKRSFPFGNLVHTTILSGGISSYNIGQGSYLINIDPVTETILLCQYDGVNNKNETVVNGNATIVEFSADGKILQQVKGIDDNQVNAVMKINGEIWAATKKVIWKQNAGGFEKVLSASANDFFANMKRKGDTLVLLSDNVQWYDLKSKKIVAKVAVANFFSTGPNDNTALILRFSHPFAVDEQGAVWLVNTKQQDNESRLKNKPYYIARIDSKGITYPLQSADGGAMDEYKNVEVVFAYNPAAAVFALTENSVTGDVSIVDKSVGYQFSFGRKNIKLDHFYFTSVPGKLLIRLSSFTKDAVFLRLSDGNIEAADVIESRSIASRNNSAYGDVNKYKPLSSYEKFYQPSRNEFKPFYYWKKGDEVTLNLPTDTCSFNLPAGISVSLNSDNGSLIWLEGSSNNTLRLTDAENKPINEKWIYDRYAYDSSSSLLSIYWSSRYSFSRYVHIVNLRSKKMIRSWQTKDMLLLPGGEEFINEGFGIYKLSDSSLVETFPDKYRFSENFICSRNGRYISFFKDNIFNPDEVVVWDRQLKKTTVLGTQQGIKQMEADPYSNLIYSLGQDESIKIWDPVAATPVAQIVLNANKGQYKQVAELRPGYLILLPDGNYMGENKYYEMLSMRNEETEYPVFQMDAKFHRPDKVLAALGYADSSLVKAISGMSDRRAKRFSQAATTDEVTIDEKAKLPYYARQKDVPFTIHLKGDAKDAAGLMLYINGTALWPYPGKPLISFNAANEFSTSVDLVDAGNHIRVCLVDKAGKETPGDYVYINTAVEEKKNLYFVGIGLSEYRDVKNNLRYAAKDMQDIAKYFSTVSSYEDVFSYTISNKMVTTKSVDSIKLFLSKATSKDQVVVYFAGHGMLDTASGNYYLSTYDWQTDKPAATGMNIDDLNKAIAGSAARKKTMMIDACNSGLMDDAETGSSYIIADTATAKRDDVISRGFEVNKKNQRSSVVSFAFNHFNQGNGVDILAASAGNEFAFETDSLKNGLFTYSLLTAFKSGDADLNKDSSLCISELQLYVSNMVSRLSKGKQQPSFRQANLYQDISMLTITDSYFSRLLQAASNDHLPTLKICLEQEKVPVNKKDDRGFTALLYACRDGAFNAVKYLMEMGADMNIKSDFGFSCLYLAAYNRNERIVYYLFDKGAKLNEQITQQWNMDTARAHATPLTVKMFDNFAAIKENEDKHYKLIGFLAKEQIASADSLFKAEKLNVNHWHLMEGVNALFVSIFQGREKSVEWLISNGANVNYTNASIGYFTPLMAAAYSNNLPIATLLLQHDADKNAKGSDGSTALKIAKKNNNSGMIALLSN